MSQKVVEGSFVLVPEAATDEQATSDAGATSEQADEPLAVINQMGEERARSFEYSIEHSIERSIEHSVEHSIGYFIYCA